MVPFRKYGKSLLLVASIQTLLLLANCSNPTRSAQSTPENSTLRIKKLLADDTKILTDDLINSLRKACLQAELRDLEKGIINVNHIDKDHYDFTPLQKVIFCMTTPSMTSSECDRIVNILLNKGANPNTRDAHGRTPLELAIDLQCVSIVGVLVAKGAVLSEKTSWGITHIEQASFLYQNYLKRTDYSTKIKNDAYEILQLLQKAQ